MLKFASLMLFFVLISNIFSQDMFSELNKMYEKKEFFKFYEKSKNSGLTGWKKSYIEVLSLSLFGKLNESNKAAGDLLSNFPNELNDSLSLRLYQVLLHNNVNLYNYSEASAITGIVLSKFEKIIEPKHKKDFENSGIIWKAAEKIQPQTVEFKADSKIETTRDLAGLMNVPVKLNSKDAVFVFDTGANFSTITESFAKKHGIRLLDGKIKVGTVTGDKVDSQLGVADELEIGNMFFKNVIFLVMPDEVLTFAGGMYKINGIVGFPVIREMNELHIAKTHIFIPQTASKKETRNLALDGFMPVINIIVGSDSLAFSFDTGAKTTILFPPYYEKYKTVIDSKYKEEDIEIEGAGGAKTIKGYIIDEINLKVIDSKARLEDVRLAKEEVIGDSKFFYGNLGQDFFKQFDEMILNFQSMYVEFK